MAKKASWVFGIIFIIAGLSGFFMQPALGFIAADTLSSIIHLVIGVVLLVMAGKSSASTALKTVGIIYVLWALLGFLSWNFTAADSVTNWFYLVVGVVIAIAGWMGKGGSAPMASPSNMGGQPQM